MGVARLEGGHRDNTKAGFLPEIHRLRGVAILMIVAAHCYQCFSWATHPAAEALFKDTFDNSSLIFIFVTGFLFQHTEEQRFAFGGYLVRKLRNVLVPFVIALTPAIAYALFRSRAEFAGGPLWESSLPARALYFAIYPGQTMDYALWFIPVIAIYYISAPLLRALDRRQVYWLLALLLPVSLLMHRPTYNEGHNLSLALYFLSSFVLGMWFSRYWADAAAWLDRHIVALSILFAVVFIGHLLLSDHHGKSTTAAPFETQGTEGLIDWVYVQKLLMVMVLLAVLHSLRDRSAKLLDFIAGASFTIFFYHLYFIYAVRWTMQFAPTEFRLDYFGALFALSIGAPCAIVYAARRLFPGWSRTLVGAS